MSSSFSLLPQQYLISLRNFDDLLLALSRLCSLPPSLVCLCPTDRQCEWLKSLWPKLKTQKQVIFLSGQALSQPSERRRHLQKYKDHVWTFVFFEFFYEKGLYFEISERVGQVWALTWGMDFHEQRAWAEMAQSSQLSPVLCSKAPMLDCFAAFESFVTKLWQREYQTSAAYCLALGEKHLLIYNHESDLRFWRRWCLHEQVTFSFNAVDASALLTVIHVKSLPTLSPDALSARALLVSSSAWELPETKYALGFSRLSRPETSLLRCVRWAALVARRQIRWF
jgi:hypothetical protein